ncbi:MAG: hypothetical protein ACRCZE_01530 [Candidatus Altimarinota bacterium]
MKLSENESDKKEAELRATLEKLEYELTELLFLKGEPKQQLEQLRDKVSSIRSESMLPEMVECECLNVKPMKLQTFINTVLSDNFFAALRKLGWPPSWS